VKYSIVAFVLFTAFVLVYPIIESTNFKKRPVVKKEISPLVLIEGDYYKYDPNLTKEGNFSKIEYKKGIYFANNFFLKNLEGNYSVFSKFSRLYKKRIVSDFVFFSSVDYNLTTDRAVYYFNNNEIKGEKFRFASLKAIGYGTSFTIKPNNDVFASNVTYFIKGLK